MKAFCLMCSGLRNASHDRLLVEMSVLPGVRIARVGNGIVTVEFDGTEAALRAFLAGTAWSAFDLRISEVRTYRLQKAGTQL